MVLGTAGNPFEITQAQNLTLAVNILNFAGGNGTLASDILGTNGGRAVIGIDAKR